MAPRASLVLLVCSVETSVLVWPALSVTALVDHGRHAIKDMHCIMLTSRFGVTIAFLEQLHLRLLREHVSFAGEADVARRYAKRKGCCEMLSKMLRLYLSQAWYFWRLGLRLGSFAARMPELDISRPVEKIAVCVGATR